MIVKILTGVFDPPPTHLSAPWGYFALFGAAAATAILAAGFGMLRATKGHIIEIVRDL